MARTPESLRPEMLSTADLRELLSVQDGPCISIYIPTVGGPDDLDQNRIRFKNQLKKVETELGINTLDAEAHSELLAPLRPILDDETFWIGTAGGVVLFHSPTVTRVRRVLHGVGEFAGVADSFHVRPLIRIVQAATRYQVLAVSSERVALYEGDHQQLVEMPLHPDVPRDMAEALGEPAHVTKQKRTMLERESHDDRPEQLTRYFRRIDEAVTRRHSHRSNLPLILAALPEYQGFFHEASHNELLLEGGIKRDPFKEVTPELLRDLAWEVLRPQYEQHIADRKERFGAAMGHQNATDDLEQAARLAVFGRLGTLMVRENHHVGGTLNPGTGDVSYKPIEDPLVDDVVDDIAETVLRQDGEVLVLRAEDMPTDTGIAAIQRF